ncbi:MAG: CDP-alcohol phosphatidyltransferase family protein [Lachnospiraceae bacterium]|nr:CDP-alcohol phosphatidyltransferase family protein [Lachnospiraceae bacterium]
MNKKMHFEKKDFFSIPNILTYIRIILVPIFVVVYINASNLSGHIWSIVIVAVSALTDLLDGFIARRFNMITDWGKIVDPIADKAMQFAMLFCVVFKYHWVALLLVIYGVKEIVSLAFSGFLFTKGKHIGGAMWCGKICTVILYAVMLVFIALPDIDAHVVTILIGFAAAFMLLAFVVYMEAYFRLYREYKKQKKEEEK